MSNLEDESAMCVPGDSFVGCDKSSEDLVNQVSYPIFPPSATSSAIMLLLVIIAAKTLIDLTLDLTHSRPSAHTIEVCVSVEYDLLSPLFTVDYVMEKAVEVIDIEKLAKDLENSSPLAIMDEALEKYGNDIAIAFSYRYTINGPKHLLQMEKKKYPVGAEHYELYEEIGQRVSASVFRAMCIPNKEIVAVKVLDFERSNIDLSLDCSGVYLLLQRCLLIADVTIGVALTERNIDMTGLFETMTLETGFEVFAGMDNGSKKRPVSTD
ncbi:hypothetical protein L2E82_36080 [Cichorium intybus]|uniref:Uncharacterized protein n=1 Tax=Cichorium intybus TaxID=13427 RepID=A0ACB9BQP7_CICIN|nr:hypothetical protein L2E82_36080 [Cichorium intybus]